MSVLATSLETSTLRYQQERRNAEVASTAVVEGNGLAGGADAVHERVEAQDMDVGRSKIDPEAPAPDEWTRWVMGDLHGESAAPAKNF